MLVISCHADTNFKWHTLQHQEDGLIYGHLDNFAGIHAVMKAYFSGRINSDYVRIELTYGEEIDFAGAFEVLGTLEQDDVVIVVDVTGVPTKANFTIEKCWHPDLQDFLFEALEGLDFEMHDDSPDPISDADETDVYSQELPLVFFMGIPCFGGDYNAGPVYCHAANIDNVAEAICRIAEAFPRLWSGEEEDDNDDEGVEMD